MSSSIFVFERPPVYTPVYVLDASVAVRFFVQESGSDLARRLLEDFSGGLRHLAAPTILQFEVANALRYNSGVTSEQLNEMLADLADLAIEWAHIPAGEMARIARFARERNLSVYDAVYVRMAHDQGVPLITADRAMMERCRDLGLVLSLEGLYGIT